MPGRGLWLKVGVECRLMTFAKVPSGHKRCRWWGKKNKIRKNGSCIHEPLTSGQHTFCAVSWTILNLLSVQVITGPRVCVVKYKNQFVCKQRDKYLIIFSRTEIPWSISFVFFGRLLHQKHANDALMSFWPSCVDLAWFDWIITLNGISGVLLETCFWCHR